MSRRHPPAPTGEPYTEVIQVKVTTDTVNRLRAVVAAINLRNGGKPATLSAVGRDGILAHLEALETEYCSELATVASFRS
jgi:hypothetical protein